MPKPEACDWCGGGVYFVARQPYLEFVDEVVWHCENCHHEMVSYIGDEEATP